MLSVTRAARPAKHTARPFSLDKTPEGPMKKVYDKIGEGHQVISGDQISKYLNKRYKGIGTKIYKILIQPAFPNLPNLN